MARTSLAAVMESYLERLSCINPRTLRLLAVFSAIFAGLLVLRQAYTQADTTTTPPFAPRKHELESGDAFARYAPVQCLDHRGDFVPGSTGAILHGHQHPKPTFGSYDALELPKTWLSFRQRYGPHGFGNSSLSRELSSVDWGRLQDDCFARNQIRFPGQQAPSHLLQRFQFVSNHADEEPVIGRRNRQAIVLRIWSTYEYQEEDLWNLRSIITEASLATGAEYQIFLLVDVKDEQSRIHEDVLEYERVLNDSVPAEFRSLAVLWHVSLLEDWYNKIPEHRAFWQIMQPFQLFAHFYPDFDHYWQFEMDTRFTGHVGELLRSLDKFGRLQPYKQSRERASWRYMESAHGTYADFSKRLNETLQGSATIWGPIEEAPIVPIGSTPHVTAEQDDFKWGIGSDADLLLLGPLNDVRRFQAYDDWIFRDWKSGFAGENPARFMSVPAQARASWELLKSIHHAQRDQGVFVPSEATLPTFALLHGLKVVGLPLPNFQYPQRDLTELDYVQNGGGLGDFPDAVANGPAKYRSSSISFFSRPLTLDWASPLCDPVFEHWQGKEGAGGREQNGHLWPAIPDGPLSFMAFVNGTAYLPSFILHPRKTSHYRGPE